MKSYHTKNCEVARFCTHGWKNREAMLISVIPSPTGHFEVPPDPFSKQRGVVRRSLKKKTYPIVPAPALLWTSQCRLLPQRALRSWQARLRGLHIFLSENWIPLPLYSVCDSLGAASVTHCQTTPNEYNRDQKH